MKENHNKKESMSNQTVGLIAILLVATVILLIVAINSGSTPNQLPIINQQHMPPPTTPTPAPHTTLSLSPNPLPIASQSATIAVAVNTASDTIAGVQIELSFDPTAIKNISITPGSFFPKSVEVLKTIDYKNGRVSYALGLPAAGMPVNGNGVVAWIKIQTNLAPGQQTELQFLPKSVVASGTMSPSLLLSATGTTITESLPTQQTASPLQPNTMSR